MGKVLTIYHAARGIATLIQTWIDRIDRILISVEDGY